LDSPDADAQKSGTGTGSVTLNISVPGLDRPAQSAQARTVYPSDEDLAKIDTYTVTVKSGGKVVTEDAELVLEENGGVKSGTVPDLAVGVTYTFTVKGYVGDGPVAEGTSDPVKIATTGNVTAAVILGPKESSEEGTFSYDIDLPFLRDANDEPVPLGETAKLTVTNNKTGTALVTRTVNLVEDGYTGTLDLPAGTYYLSVEISLPIGNATSDNTAKFAFETIHVYAGLESAFAKTYGAKDFAGVLKGTQPVAALQSAIATASTAGSSVTLEDVTITGTGLLDLGKAAVKIVGTLNLPKGVDATGIEIDASKATVTVTDATITGDNKSIIAAKDSTAKAAFGTATTGTGIHLVDRLGLPGENEAFGSSTVTGVAEYTLDGNTHVPLRLTIYVYKTLTVAGDPGANGILGSIHAVENVALAAPTLKTALLNTTKVDVSAAVISIAASYSPKTVEVTLPSTIESFRFNLSGEQDTLTVTGGTTKFAVTDWGNGVLKLASPLPTADVTILGTGRVEFTNATVGGPVFTAGSSISAGYVKFEKGFTTPSSGTVTLNGEVIIPETQAITFGSAGTVTLAAGSVVATATPAGNNPSLTVPPDSNTDDEVDESLVLTGTATKKLTFKASKAIESDGAIEFDGKAVDFGGAVTFGGAATFKENVVFGGDVTLKATGSAVFEKTAFFADGTELILTAVASTVTLDKDTGGALAVGTPAGNASDVWLHVLDVGSADVVLTPAANTKLTFSASPKGITQSAVGTNAHSIAVGGTATLVSGTTYTVASEATKLGTLAVSTSTDELTLGGGFLDGDGDPVPGGTHSSPAVLLTGAASTSGAKLTGEGSLVAGGTTIVGGTAGTAGWQVSGTGTVTIATDTITASAPTAVLTAVTGTTPPTITVAAGETLSIGADTTVKSGFIALGTGTWTATSAATTIGESIITLGANASAAFGAGTGATVLTGGDDSSNTFTASGSLVTLAQSAGKLTITGSAATATLTTGNTAGIDVNAGLDITTAIVAIPANTSIIKLAVADAVGIKLANENSVILLDSSKDTETSTGKAITNLTVGTGVKVFAETNDGNKDVGKFVGAATDNTIVASGESPFSLTKGIKTASI
jgi:hypothetical protein